MCTYIRTPSTNPEHESPFVVSYDHSMINLSLGLNILRVALLVLVLVLVL